MLDIDIQKTYKNKSRSAKIVFQAQIEIGSTTAIFGKSGIGKTSVLRMIAGLDDPDQGHIHFGSEQWFSPEKHLPLSERSFGMVFQDFNLFKNMSLKQNLEYAGGSIDKNTTELIESIGLSDLMNAYPAQLSGGQRQKLAILRTVGLKSKLLLLDEPFSALDDESILECLELINNLKARYEITVILVTHRKDVILRAANSVVMMKEEGCEQGFPKKLLTLSI